MKVWHALAGALAIVAVSLLGCGSETKTVTETSAAPPAEEAANGGDEGDSESLGGSEESSPEYPRPGDVGRAIVADIEARYGDGLEGGQCEDFLPELGGTPVYLCEIKMGGDWHSIEATIHPDGSFEWIESGGSISGNYEGSELAVE